MLSADMLPKSNERVEHDPKYTIRLRSQSQRYRQPHIRANEYITTNLQHATPPLLHVVTEM
jgi:hypothetical protein